MTPERMQAVETNINFYERFYFYFDKPVEYTIAGKIIKIYPISVEDSEIFLSSISVINVDKNSSDSVEIIKMPYLSFIYKVLFRDDNNKMRLLNLVKYCLQSDIVDIGFEDKTKPFLKLSNGIKITAKDFDEIRKIILYQNLIHYDDEYVDPEMKKMMLEMDAVKNSGLEMPSLERRIAIITAHCGLSKQEQIKMTYRSHSLLFEEVYGEVEFETTRPIALYAGQGDKLDHWIYRKKKDKYTEYMVSMDSYVKSMGADVNAIKSAPNAISGDILTQQYNNFSK